MRRLARWLTGYVPVPRLLVYSFAVIVTVGIIDDLLNGRWEWIILIPFAVVFLWGLEKLAGEDKDA